MNERIEKPRTFLKPALLAICLLALVAAGAWWGGSLFTHNTAAFDGERALADVETQLDLGPRPPGSAAHSRTVKWIAAELKKNGWTVEIQETTRLGHPVRNIIAMRGQGEPWIILGAHYDTRFIADQDPDPAKRDDPVPGANDGASGVAVLLELSRALPRRLDQQIWLVFFDAEDNGNYEGWEWILGSQAFVDALEGEPDAAVIVDMIGDKDLNIHLERNSNQKLAKEIWARAAKLGHGDVFISTPKYRMIDDHTPFLNAGIPAVDIIDFDYPYWHTTEDTLDKVSAESLQAVGETLLNWILSQ